MDQLERFLQLISPVKTVFSLYLLMYVLPVSVPVIVALQFYEAMVVGSQLNIAASIIVLTCGAVAFIWTIFFLIYFTNQRNKNPELYQKGFMSELNVSGESDEQ
ncbi:MAG: hypothetical protein RPU63_13640 [Candidatus Sedimenticola sp. (ex Thyasira tokunagai)]